MFCVKPLSEEDHLTQLTFRNKAIFLAQKKYCKCQNHDKSGSCSYVKGELVL